jgi:hypothetical protein
VAVAERCRAGALLGQVIGLLTMAVFVAGALIGGAGLVLRLALGA